MPKEIPKIIISQDKMQAVLDFAFSPASGPVSVTRELMVWDFEQALKKAGVFLPPAEGLLQDVADRHNAGHNVRGTVLVYGIPPRKARGRQLVPDGDFAFPVFPGDTIGRMAPAVPCRSGMDVFGRIIPAKSDSAPPEDIHTSPGGELAEEADGTVTARRYGLVKVENNCIRLEPLLHLSSDLMALSATIFPKDFKGKQISEERIIDAVRALKLRARVNSAILELALNKAEKNGYPTQDVVLCTGLNPFPGEDGRLEILVRQQNSRLPGLKDNSGNIDYKQRGSIDTVRSGCPVARIHPPGKGRPGRNLLGELLPPKEGAPCSVALGENVSQDGRDVVAAADGLLSYSNDEIKVSEVYVVDGDVGPHTGHVMLDHGSIQIEGTVLAGFHVSCPGSILIKGTVEDSIITAGEDIDVDGGIVMNANGMLKAGGSLRALFAVGANIRVGKNLYITNEINKSEVLAEGNVVVAGGQGKIIGGSLACGGEIQAVQIGSELGAPTKISLGRNEQIVLEYKQEHERLIKSLQHIRQKLNGKDAALKAKYAANKQQQASIQFILNARNSLSARLNEIEKALARLEAMSLQKYSPPLRAEGIIYPGTSIHCGAKSVRVRNPISRSRVYYNFVEDKFIVAGL
ncbi:MAG: DUF342 domain-containing protein [Desulfovibrionaceae bacterium]|nr:DUF342 domain-containing protein [Desulfovibrionaceae bacterium]